MTLMDSLSVWYSAGPEANRLSQVQVRLLLGFIAQDNLQVCGKFLLVVLCLKCMFGVTVVVYGGAAHLVSRLMAVLHPCTGKMFVLVLTVRKFTLQSCQCAPPEHEKEAEAKLLEARTMWALVAVI